MSDHVAAAESMSARDDDDHSTSSFTATSSSAALEWTMTGATAQTILTMNSITDEKSSVLGVGAEQANNENGYMDDEDEPSLLSNNTNSDEEKKEEAASDVAASINAMSAATPAEKRKLPANPRDDNGMFFHHHNNSSSSSGDSSSSSAPVAVWVEHLLTPTSSKQKHSTHKNVRGNGAGGAVKARIERWELQQQRMQQQKRPHRQKRPTTTDSAPIPGIIAVSSSFHHRQDSMSYPTSGSCSTQEKQENSPNDQELGDKPKVCQQQPRSESEIAATAAANGIVWDDGLPCFLEPVKQAGTSLQQGQREKEENNNKVYGEEQSDSLLPYKNPEDTTAEVRGEIGATFDEQGEEDKATKLSLPPTIWRPLNNIDYEAPENDDVERQRRLVNERSTTLSSSNMTAISMKGDSTAADAHRVQRRRQALAIFFMFALMAIAGGALARTFVEGPPAVPSASPSTAEPTRIWRNDVCHDATQVNKNSGATTNTGELWFDDLKSVMSVDEDSIDCLSPIGQMSKNNTGDVKGRWYSLLGSGLTMTVNFCTSSAQIAVPLILTGRCGALKCETQNVKRTVRNNLNSTCSILEELVFVTELNVPYWIFVYTTGNTTNIIKDDLLRYGLSISTNDVCSGALDIDIGDTGKTRLVGSTTSALIDQTAISCGNSGTLGMPVMAPSVWFRLQGAGKIVSLDTCENNASDVALSIYKGNDCIKLECVSASLVQYNSCGASWLAEEGVLYHILLQSTGSFALTATETEPCSLEITISCVILPFQEDCSTFRLNPSNQFNDFSEAGDESFPSHASSFMVDVSMIVTVTLPEKSESAVVIQNLTAVTNYAGPNGLDVSERLNGTTLRPGQSTSAEITGSFDIMRAYSSIFTAVARATNGEICKGVKSSGFAIGGDSPTVSPTDSLEPTQILDETGKCAISAVLFCDGCKGNKPNVTSCTYSYPTAFWFAWTGRPCNKSTSGDSFFTCQDFNTTALRQDNLWIVVHDSANEKPIFVGHRFSLFNPVRFNLSNDTIAKASIKISIVEASSQGGSGTVPDGKTIQTMEFGINCGDNSNDISLLTDYGALQLVGFESAIQGAQRIYEYPTFELTLVNSGDSPADITSVTMSISELEYQAQDMLVGKRLLVRDRDAGAQPYLLYYEANLVTIPTGQPLRTRIEAVNVLSGVPCSANVVLALPY